VTLALHPPTEDDIRHVKQVALGIAHSWRDRADYDYYHSGILFRDADDNVRLLHLADHCQLANETPPPNFVWADFRDLDSLVGEQVINACERVWEMYGKEGIPYSFLNNTQFNEDFTLTSAGDGSGFTCSTFVFKLLERRGLVLLDESTWRERPKDKYWRCAILHVLGVKHGNTAAAHIAKLQTSDATFRIQPLDVIAALAFPAPASFDECEAVIADVASQIPRQIPRIA
jgi:hypothetical protein